MNSTPDWTKGSPSTISGRLRRAEVSERKCRLFCTACCRLSQKHIKHDLCLTLLTLVEEWADDPSRAEEVARQRRALHRWAHAIHPAARSERDWLARWSVWCAAAPKLDAPVQGFTQPAAYRPLLREVFGDQLTPPTFEANWRTPDVLGLAGPIYSERAFERLPILADALSDAGCTDELILAHCRSGGNHVRGCWALDLALGLQ